MAVYGPFGVYEGTFVDGQRHGFGRMVYNEEM
jgi:hypothetical protein